MFESITIAQQSSDAGSAAEALVYYGKTDMILRGGTLIPFVKSFGFHALMRAIDMGLMELTYEVAAHVVVTNKAPSEVHGFVIAAQHNPKKNRPMSAAEQIEQHFKRAWGNSSEVRAQARLLGERAKERIQPEAILAAVQSQITDKSYLENCIREMLQALVPEYQAPKDLGLETFDTGQGFVVLTKLDFQRINEIYHRTVPVEHSSITMALLLGNMLDAEKELDFAGQSGSDLWVNETGSAILRLRSNSSANRAVGAREHIDYFQHVEFEGRTFRSAINSGERMASELLDLLETDDARRFKVWLSEQPPAGALLKEYDRAIFAANGWANRLPFKTGKLLVFAGIGVAVDQAVGTFGLATGVALAASYASGLTVGASEEILTSRLAKGWKPNQFIEGPATDFVQPDSKK
jgi:hypothetical protein